MVGPDLFRTAAETDSAVCLSQRYARGRFRRFAIPLCWTALCWFTLGWTALGGSSAAAEEPRILIGALRQHLSSIRSIDVKFKMHAKLTEMAAREGSRDPGDKPMQGHWIWTPTREKYELLGPNGERYVSFVFDGNRSAEFHSGPTPGSTTGVTLRPEAREETRRMIPYAWMVGLRNPDAPQSLLELMSQPGVQSGPLRSIEGKNYPTLTVSQPAPGGGTLQAIVTLDPTQDYSPIQLEYLVDRITGQIKPEWAPRTRIALRQLTRHPQVGGTGLLIPHEAEIETPFEIMRVSVDSIQVNEPVLSAEFVITIPDGLNVVEIGKPGSGPQKQYVSGGPKVVEARLQAQRAEFEKEWKRLETEGVQFDATPRPSRKYLWWLVGLSSGLLVVALIIRLRRNRQA